MPYAQARSAESSAPLIALRLTVAVTHRPALLLEALGWMLTASGFEVTAQAPDGAALCAAVRDAPPDVVLVGAESDRERPLRAVGQVRALAPEVRCVALVPRLTPSLALAAVREEVDGVVECDTSAAELADSIRQIAAGHAVFPAGWLALLRRARADSLGAHLSARQLQVLELLSRGLTNHEIAGQLEISLNTVKFHLREIYGRVGVANRVQAARLLAQQHVAADGPHQHAA